MLNFFFVVIHIAYPLNRSRKYTFVPFKLLQSCVCVKVNISKGGKPGTKTIVITEFVCVGVIKVNIISMG